MKMKNLFIFSLLFLMLSSFSFAALNVDVDAEFRQQVAEGKLEGYSLVHKFGATTLDTSIHPATISQTYKTPTIPISLEFVSSDIDDTALGDGAREITIQCLNSSFLKENLTINTAGTTPVALPKPCYRIDRWLVSKSGTYANDTIGSHEGTLTIRVLGGGDTWTTIGTSPFPAGQSQIGAYSCEKGKTAYLLSKNIFIDTRFEADVYFFRRPEINRTTAPYSTMRLIQREVGVSGGYSLKTGYPKKICECPCDMGFMGEVSTGTAEGSFEFEILLVDNNLTSILEEKEKMSIETSFSSLVTILACALIVVALLWITTQMDKEHSIYKILSYLLVFIIFIIAGATVAGVTTGIVLYKLSLWILPITFIYILIYLFYRYYAKKH